MGPGSGRGCACTPCATVSRPICSNAAPISESSRRFSEWRHTAHEQPTEARITYRFHPRFGEVVQIRRRLKCGGVEFVVVLQPDGSFASLPAWMTEPAASRFRDRRRAALSTPYPALD